MNYWKHSLLSRKKFGGTPEDYLAIHRFMDASKLFRYDMRHRILLHNTYGIEICVNRFGETLRNSDGKQLLVRDLAAEHCKEDLLGVVPTLNAWFKNADDAVAPFVRPLSLPDGALKDFVMKPFLMSGLRSSLVITHSNFGIYLASELLGLDAALELGRLVEGVSVNEILPMVPLTERWQYMPDLKQLKQIELGNI